MNSLGVVRAELSAALDMIDPVCVSVALAAFDDKHRRWFTSGQGRSRLVASMAAMRLMHVGFDVHVVGETTAPSIRADDRLLMLSASGETPVTVHLARRAVEAGATVIAITTSAQSTLGELADIVVPLPMPMVLPTPAGRQFGGSLFEQTALVLLDSMILDLMAADPHAQEQMRRRHTNLE